MRLHYLNKTPDWLRIFSTFTKWPVPGRRVVCWLLQPPGIPGSPGSWMSKTQGHGRRRALGAVLGFAFLVLAAFSTLLHSSGPRRSDRGIEASRGKMAPEWGCRNTHVGIQPWCASSCRSSAGQCFILPLALVSSVSLAWGCRGAGVCCSLSAASKCALCILCLHL